MGDTIDGLTEKLSTAAESLGVSWDGYGSPGKSEYRVVLDSCIEYMEDLEGSVSMELPNAGVKVDRDEAGVYNVYLKVGSIQNDGES